MQFHNISDSMPRSAIKSFPFFQRTDFREVFFYGFTLEHNKRLKKSREESGWVRTKDRKERVALLPKNIVRRDRWLACVCMQCAWRRYSSSRTKYSQFIFAPLPNYILFLPNNIFWFFFLLHSSTVLVSLVSYFHNVTWNNRMKYVRTLRLRLLDSSSWLCSYRTRSNPISRAKISSMSLVHLSWFGSFIETWMYECHLFDSKPQWQVKFSLGLFLHTCSTNLLGGSIPWHSTHSMHALSVNENSSGVQIPSHLPKQRW